jgi:hypothetical protein
MLRRAAMFVEVLLMSVVGGLAVYFLQFLHPGGRGMKNEDFLKRMEFAGRIGTLANELEAAGFTKAQGLLWFSLAELLMAEDFPPLEFLEIAAVHFKLLPVFADWKEKQIEQIKRDLKPEIGDPLDEMIQKVTEWPESLE